MASPAAILSIYVSAKTGPAVKGLARVNTQLDATAAKSGKAAAAMKTVGKVGALGVAVGIGMAVKKAADFEQQMSSLGAVSNATGRDMKRFKKQALDAGAATKFSALDAAKAQTELAKGGLSVSQIMKGGLKSSLALAAAGEMDLAEAAETTANAIKLFGLRGKETMKVADQFATAANKTTADVTDFAMALKQGGGVAKMAGLSFTETMLALEALAETGVRNADAGTSMKTAFIQLLKPSAKQAELAKSLGLNFVSASGGMKNMSDISTMLRDKLGGMTKAQRTAALATLAGTDGVRTLNALYAAGPAKLDKMRAGLDKSGTAAETAAKKQDNLKGKLENLQGSIETLAIVVGSALLPALSDGAVAATKFINSLTTGKGAGAQFSAMLTSLRTSLGMSKADWQAFGQAITNAWNVAHAVMMRVLPAMIQMIRGWVQITGGLLKILTGILTLDFRRAWDGVKQVFAGGLNAILGNLRLITAPFRAAVAALASSLRGPLGAAFRAVRSLAGSVMRAVLGALKAQTGPWRAAAGALGSAVRGPVGSAMRGMRDTVGKVLSAVQSAFSGSSKRILTIMAGLGGGLAAVTGGIRGIFHALAQVVRDVVRYISKAINKLVSAVGKAKDKIGDLAPSLPSLPNIPGIPGIQRGGAITQGKPSGDSVPAMLEKGEYVLNRKAVNKAGRKQLDQLNYGMAPRFQKGGPVGMASGGLAGMIGAANKLDRAQFPYLWGGGHQGSPAPFGPMDCSGAVSFVLQHGGVKIPTMTSGLLANAGRPGAGKVTVFANPDHTYMRIGSKYFGTSGANPGGGAGWFPGSPRPGFSVRHFPTSGAVGAFGDAASQIPAIKIGGEGPLAAAAQGATNKMRQVANAYVGRNLEPMGGGDAEFKGGQFSKAALKKLWVRAGGAPGMANTMAAIALAESGGDAGIQNSIGASGLWQIHPPQPGWQNPLKNAKMAIGKLASQGLSAWEVYTKGTYRNFLQKGGAVGMAKGGGLPKQLGKALKTIRKGKAPKRSKAMKGLMKNIKKIGLPKSLTDSLVKHEANANRYGDLASTAGQLTSDATNAKGEPILDPEGRQVTNWGKVEGLTEAQWTTKQLESLFAWRNKLIAAHDQVVAKRKHIAELVEQAKKAYAKVSAEIKRGTARKKAIAKQLKVLRKHPKTNKKAIARLHKEGMALDKSQRGRVRVRDAIKNKILPGLGTQRTGLKEADSTFTESLGTVQGVGGSMTKLGKLPALGVLRGEIFNAQLRLRDLGIKPPIQDRSTTSEVDTTKADLLAGLLKEANQRTAVSEAQFRVLRNMPPFGGSFATGGVVPGPLGAPRSIIAHGGETVQPLGQGNDVNVNLHFAPGMEWLRKFVQVEVERETRKASRGVGRTPGRAGSLGG